ncbi:uncharacterized protein LOC122864712 [Siniperca chuatsi]|uniref:uncharacterized protein LOC122864712 n=1 Tax=Siniperca chuatsi TaxID=119488 RepID=UPI001CE1FDBD|nr:uncharacterized protein LOC122864712 [Siniperca chuatsi]
MIVVKQVVLLLLPLLAVIGTDAAPGPGDCRRLTKMLSTKDFHKIVGDWVLVWSVSDYQQGSDRLGNLSSSYMELQLLPDNKTIVFNERNMFLNRQCFMYGFNVSMPFGPSEYHTLHIISALAENFIYENCSDCLAVLYRGKMANTSKVGRFLLIYRREGHHQDVELLKAAHSDHKKLAECLGFPHDKPFSYDGATGSCHLKSSPYGNLETIERHAIHAEKFLKDEQRKKGAQLTDRLQMAQLRRMRIRTEAGTKADEDVEKGEDDEEEAIPTAKQDSAAVAKSLIRDIVPRWGIPDKISSDNGTPFMSAALKSAAERKLHDLEPGDWIVVKDFRRKNWRARRWNGPYQILLTTETAVKVAERATWIHATHCKVGLRGHGDGVLLAVIIVLSSVSLMETFKSQLTPDEGGVKREVPSIFPNIPAQLEDNAWYATMLTTARKVTNQSCYACVQLPHGVGDSIPVKPTPLNVSETLGVMVAFTRGVTLQNRTVRDMGAALKLCNISITNYDGSTARFWNMSQITQQGIHWPIMSTNPTSQASTAGWGPRAFINRPASLLSFCCPDRAQSRVCLILSQSRMIVVKRAVLLLLLPPLLAVIGTDAAPCTGDCARLTKMLPTKDVHKILGEWVLVWSVSDTQQGSDRLGNLSSSYIKLQLLPDNKTIVYNERSMLLDMLCSKLDFNISLNFDPSEYHTLHIMSALAENFFYESCSDCLAVLYRGKMANTRKVGRFLFIYRREGHHRDVELLKAAHSDHKKLAECLGFPHDKPFSYDGVADFCRKKSSPAAQPEQSFLSQSRMIVVKRAVLLLLLLLLAVIGTDAAPGPGHCGVLNKTLPTKDFHKIFGDWVLVWSVSDYQLGSDVLGNLSSSHVKLQLLPDNKTIVYNERNMFLDKPCTQYFINMSMPSDPSDSDHHTLHTEAAMVEKDGVVQPYNDSGDVDFYESCSDCLVMVYREKEFQFLLIYRREGHHRDVELLKAAHSDHKKLAECLGFPHDRPFSYDGVADFCHKKSSPAAEPEQS